MRSEIQQSDWLVKTSMLGVMQRAKELRHECVQGISASGINFVNWIDMVMLRFLITTKAITFWISSRCCLLWILTATVFNLGVDNDGSESFKIQHPMKVTILNDSSAQEAVNVIWNSEMWVKIATRLSPSILVSGTVEGQVICPCIVFVIRQRNNSAKQSSSNSEQHQEQNVYWTVLLVETNLRLKLSHVTQSHNQVFFGTLFTQSWFGLTPATVLLLLRLGCIPPPRRHR